MSTTTKSPKGQGLEVSIESYATMQSNNLDFEKLEGSSYGSIGWLTRNGKRTVLIFKGCFYISDDMFPLNVHTLELIKDIQKNAK